MKSKRNICPRTKAAQCVYTYTQRRADHRDSGITRCSPPNVNTEAASGSPKRRIKTPRGDYDSDNSRLQRRCRRMHQYRRSFRFTKNKTRTTTPLPSRSLAARESLRRLAFTCSGSIDPYLPLPLSLSSSCPRVSSSWNNRSPVHVCVRVDARTHIRRDFLDRRPVQREGIRWTSARGIDAPRSFSRARPEIFVCERFRGSSRGYLGFPLACARARWLSFWKVSGEVERSRVCMYSYTYRKRDRAPLARVDEWLMQFAYRSFEEFGRFGEINYIERWRKVVFCVAKGVE